MKLYHITQNEKRGYDTYSDAVVCAENEDEAKYIHPNGRKEDMYKPEPSVKYDWYEDRNVLHWSWIENRNWATSPNNVSVEYIGEAAEHLKSGVICASYHAG